MWFLENQKTWLISGFYTCLYPMYMKFCFLKLGIGREDKSECK